MREQTFGAAFLSGVFLFFAWAVGAQERPIVFVSIPPQAWLLRRLAGESVEVQTLLAPGVNPHTYEPTARQIKKLAESRLYLTVGLPFEVSLALRVSRLNPALKVAAMDAGITKRGAPEHHHGHDEPGHVCAAGGDPHIWLAPQLLCVMASNTVAALEQVLPQQRAALAANLEQTLAEIRTTDQAVREKLGGLKRRTWVVYHPSWGYLADAYGLTLLVIEQDGKTPSARHLTEVIDRTRAAGVATVFTEPQYDKRPAQTLAQQVGARVVVLDPLQEDWPALMREVAEKLTDGQPRSPAVNDR